MPLYKRQDDELFYANIKVKLPITASNNLFDEVFDCMESIDNLYNSYSENSYLNRINSNAGQWVEVNSQMIDILRQAIYISQLFDGQYDISILPLLELWGFYKKEAKTYPSTESLNKVLELVNYKHIQIENNRVRIEPNQKLISGSFIKAYAVDKARDLLAKNSIQDALINAGGSTILALAGKEQNFWTIDISNQFQLKLKNKCFSTSIQNQNPLVLEGKKVGHIINAKTAYASNNLQVGIISDNCMLGDMLSTAFMTCQAKDFTNKMMQIQSIYPNIQGFLIDENEVFYQSNQFSDYIL